MWKWSMAKHTNLKKLEPFLLCEKVRKIVKLYRKAGWDC